MAGYPVFCALIQSHVAVEIAYILTWSHCAAFAVVVTLAIAFFDANITFINSIAL